MGKSVRTSLLVGTAIVAVADAVWLFAALFSPASNLMGLAAWGALPFAAFVTASLSPTWKVLVGTAVVVPAALLFAVTNAAFDALGNKVNFAGLSEALVVVLHTLPFGGLLCAVGAVLGYVWGRFVAHA